MLRGKSVSVLLTPLRKCFAGEVALDSFAQVLFQVRQIFALRGDAAGLCRRIPACSQPAAFFIALDRKDDFLNIHNETMRQQRPDCKSPVCICEMSLKLAQLQAFGGMAAGFRRARRKSE